jgi:pimeloyl-ACP methyl ester carboxylesterase
MPDTPVTFRVHSGDVAIAVHQHTAPGPDRPTVVLVHGYPDQASTWDTLVERLPRDRWHIVAYDVRGAGDSDAPSRREEYRSERLVDDLVAVLDEVLPEGGRAHLVGHDWGSVQLWDAVAAESTDRRLTGRIASFTSISGPSLDHAAWVSRHSHGRRRAVLAQQLHSGYIAWFCTPGLPRLTWERWHEPIGRLMAKREHLPADHWGPELGRNASNGLELYRANVFQRMRRPGRLHTDVPVLVVHPTRDAFLTEVLTEDLDQACSDVRVEKVRAGHWVIVTHADEIAKLVQGHVDAH